MVRTEIKRGYLFKVICMGMRPRLLLLVGSTKTRKGSQDHGLCTECTGWMDRECKPR